MSEICIANEWGSVSGGTDEIVAQRGRSYAGIRVGLCEDGLYRMTTYLQYSYGGHCGPIFLSTPGHKSFAEARTAAMEELIRDWPKGNLHEPQSVLQELSDLREQVAGQLQQPSLF